MNIEEMRQYVRHATETPIQCMTPHGQLSDNPVMRNVSKTGMCFTTGTKIDPKSNVQLKIPFHGADVELLGTVMWCHDMESHFELGVRFDDNRPDTTTKMIEQICSVEEYRQQVKERERRQISSDEAAREWMEKFADGTVQ